MTERNPKVRNFYHEGLNIYISKVSMLSAETVVYKLPRGTTAGEVFEFNPNYGKYAETGPTPSTVIDLIHGSQRFFDDLDGGIYPNPPTHLYGTTNPKMSAIATKYFGFTEIKRHR